MCLWSTFKDKCIGGWSWTDIGSSFHIYPFVNHQLIVHSLFQMEIKLKLTSTLETYKLLASLFRFFCSTQFWFFWSDLAVMTIHINYKWPVSNSNANIISFGCLCSCCWHCCTDVWVQEWASSVHAYRKKATEIAIWPFLFKSCGHESDTNPV